MLCSYKEEEMENEVVSAFVWKKNTNPMTEFIGNNENCETNHVEWWISSVRRCCDWYLFLNFLFYYGFCFVFQCYFGHKNRIFGIQNIVFAVKIMMGILWLLITNCYQHNYYNFPYTVECGQDKQSLKSMNTKSKYQFDFIG